VADERTIDVQAKYVTLSITVAKATTSTTSFPLGERIVDTLDVKWAPGHVGLVGFRITYNSTTILPWNQTASFIVGDNERIVYEMGLHVSAPLSVTVRNQDTFPHTVILTAKLREIDLPALAPISLLSLAEVS
jgi:hypothetical protein